MLSLLIERRIRLAMDKHMSRHHRSYTDTSIHFKRKSVKRNHELYVTPKHTQTSKTFRNIQTLTVEN